MCSLKRMFTLDWLQFLKPFSINVSYYILVASLTLMALYFKTEPSESIYYDTLMKNCFKDWSQSMFTSF